MDIYEFINSISGQKCPSNDILIKALWFEKKGDWNRAHLIVQDIDSADAAWIHAYLHRKEGDEWNAKYWYRNASKEFPKISLDEEWEKLSIHFLQN